MGIGHVGSFDPRDHLKAVSDALNAHHLAGNQPFAYFSSLAVHPDYEGRLIASAINEERENIAKKNGRTGVVSWTHSKNTRRLRVFEREGYAPLVSVVVQEGSRKVRRHYFFKPLR